MTVVKYIVETKWATFLNTIPVNSYLMQHFIIMKPGKDNVHVTPITTLLSKDRISYKVGSQWNQLPESIKNLAGQSQTIFTNHLMKFLISPLNKPCNKSGCYICGREN